MGQGYIFRATKSITGGNAQQTNSKIGEESIGSSKEITAVFTCENCVFETEDKNELAGHVETNHSIKCDH